MEHDALFEILRRGCLANECPDNSPACHCFEANLAAVRRYVRAVAEAVATSTAKLNADMLGTGLRLDAEALDAVVAQVPAPEDVDAGWEGDEHG